MSPVKPPPPSSSQMLARLLGAGDDAPGGPGSARGARRLGWIALAVVALTILLLALAAWPLIQLRSHPPTAIAESKPDEPLLETFVDTIDSDLAQIEGRSLFAVPPPPAPKKDIAKKSSPRPTRYGGPAVIAMINNQVWLANGDHLGAGESKGGVKVVSLDAPWSAKLEYEGAEFDVEFFQRSPLLAKGGSRTAPLDGASPATPEPTPKHDAPVIRPVPPAGAAPAPPNTPEPLTPAGGDPAPHEEPAAPPSEPPAPPPGQAPPAAPPPSEPPPVPASDPENRQP